MARAAKEAGKITGNTTAELQANLNKLMESGKALSYEILPYFTKQLHEAARKNDALNYALKRLFSVQLGRAKLNMQLFSNEIWKGGLLEGMQQLLKVFNDFSILSQPFAKFIGVTLRNAMITLTAPFEIVLQLVKDIAAAFGVEFDGDMATQIAKITGVLVTLIAMTASFKLLAGSFKFLFGILGGSAAAGAASTMTKLGSALLRLGMIYQSFDFLSNFDSRSVMENVKSGLGVAAVGGLKYGNPLVKGISGTYIAGQVLDSYYSEDKGDKDASDNLINHLNPFSAINNQPFPVNPWQGGKLEQWFGFGKKEPTVPSLDYNYMRGITGLGNPYSNLDQRAIDINLTVKGTDGLIEVIQETSSNVVTDTMNHNQQRLTRGRE